MTIIGIDFDNTIARYDGLFHRLAVEKGLADSDCPPVKKRVRDLIRSRADGEMEWRRVQAEAYGPRIGEAEPMGGVREFIKNCLGQGLEVHIISHKTEQAAAPDSGAGTNLREAALGWMESQGFFEPEGLGLSPDRVHFTSTRAEKIELIEALGCAVFIDDLEETFLEPDFPAGVERVLFDPHGDYEPRPDLWIAAGWPEIGEHILAGQKGPAEAGLPQAFSSLLGREVTAMEPIAGGNNSRIFRLDCGPERFCGKLYFRHPADSRDRLAAEFGALSFLWDQGVRSTPEPIAADRERGLAAYSFIEGRPIAPDEVGGKEIDAAIGFLCRLNELKDRAGAAGLGPASEACFSIQAIVDNLDARLARLQALREEGGQYQALRSFLGAELLPAKEKLVRRARSLSEESGQPFEADLALAEQTLSPSDFGFHNALRLPGGRMAWLDFEYFGWDDPAKMISDFLLHPAMSLTGALKGRFLDGMLAGLKDQGRLAARVRAVQPLFGLKWCLIMLNEFVPADLARRDFARGERQERAAVQARQLDKAREMLKQAVAKTKDSPVGNVNHAD